MAKPIPSPLAVHKDFVEAFPEEGKIDNRGARVNPGIDAKRDRLIRECYRRINKQGWDVATVVSVLTFDLDLNLGYGGHVTMPKKPGGAAYITKVIDKPYIDPEDEGDGKIVPVPVFPTEIAEDLVREYAQTGGIFFYVGDMPLDKYVDPITGETGKAMLERAQQNVLTWYEMLYTEGLDQWSKDPRHRNITDRQRDAAKELYRLGIVHELPAWTKVSREESPNTNCEACGANLAKIAKFCPTCDTILQDPDWVKEHRPDIWVKNNKSSLDFFIEEEKKRQAADAGNHPKKA